MENIKGKTLQEVAKIQPDYIEWCIKNLTHFGISSETIGEIQEIVPTFKLSDDALGSINKKEEGLYDEETIRDSRAYLRYIQREQEKDNFDALTDGQFGDYDDWGGDWDQLRDAMGY